jgi:hypothetical protein
MLTYETLTLTRARDKGNPNQDWTTMKVSGGGLIIVNEKTKRIITMTGEEAQ